MQLTVPPEDRARLLRCIVACQQSLSSLFEGGGATGGLGAPTGTGTGAGLTSLGGGNSAVWGESQGMILAEGDTDPYILRKVQGKGKVRKC